MSHGYRITEVTPAEFWGHGYNTGHWHGSNGWPNILDDPPAERMGHDAKVIPLQRRREGQWCAIQDGPCTGQCGRPAAGPIPSP